MTKISRNAPCPCGSGKKYKKCCLENNLENANTTKIVVDPIDKEQQDSELLYQEIQELDDLSNSVIDLIQSKHFDEAEAACQQLLQEYPQQVDGFERMGQLHEAKGNNDLAASYNRKTAEFMKINDGFDPENIKWHIEQADRLEQIKGK